MTTRSAWTLLAAVLACGCASMIAVTPTPPEQTALLQAVQAHEEIDLDACVFPSGNPPPPTGFMSAMKGGEAVWDHQKYFVDFFNEKGQPPFRSVRAAESLDDAKGCDLSLKAWSSLERGFAPKTHVYAEVYASRSKELLTRLDVVLGMALYDYEKAEYIAEGSKKHGQWESGSLWRVSRLAAPLYAQFKKGTPLYARARGAKAAASAPVAAEAPAARPEEQAPAAPASRAPEPPKPRPLSREQAKELDSQL